MDSDASNQPLLNANQRRHFEVLLASLEDALAEVIVAAESPDRGDDRALAVVRHDLPDGFADAALPRIAEAAALIRAAAERWQLSPRELSLRRAVRATLTAQLIRLEESTVEGLRGYGPIDPRASAEVDPMIAALHDIVADLLALLHGRPFRDAT